MSNNKYFLITDIIPLTKLPNKAPDFFSYFTNKNLNIGSLVEIELKNKKVIGYVFRIDRLEYRRFLIKNQKINLKPVIKIINNSPIITSNQIKLAFWLKNYSNVSLATAFSMIFPYKKLATFQIKKYNIKNNFEKNKRKFEIEFFNELNKNILKDKKTLIVVPQQNYLYFLTKTLDQVNLIYPKQKNFLNILEKIVNKNKEIFIGNKNSVFLPWENLDQLIVYEEGSIFYKDFFKPPYFNYKKIFLKFCEINKIKYIAISKLPSFDLINKKSLNIKIQTNNKIERISEKEFENKINNFKKTVIFIPEKNFGSNIICEFCFQSLICNKCGKYLCIEENFVYCPYCLKKETMPNICPYCKNKSNFLIYHKGAKAIYGFLNSTGKKTYFLEKEDEKIIKNFNEDKEAILIGSLLLFNPLIEKIDSFFFYNFDQFYYSYDFFVKEKFIRIINFYLEKANKIFLIGKIKNTEIENQIKNGSIINYLINERKINNLPPFKRLVILKEGSTNLNGLQKKLLYIKEKIKKRNPLLDIFGPLFAKPFKIKNRFFLELVIKINDDLNFNLKNLLEDINIEELDCDALSY